MIYLIYNKEGELIDVMNFSSVEEAIQYSKLNPSSELTLANKDAFFFNSEEEDEDYCDDPLI